MARIATLNGAVAAVSVSDTDKFPIQRGSNELPMPASVMKAYTIAEVLASIAALQAVDTTTAASIAALQAAVTALQSSVAGLAVVSFNARTASYVVTVADAAVPFVVITMNVATANTLTLPSNATAAIPVGSTVQGLQIGAGTTSWLAGSGATVTSRGNLLAFAGQGAGASALKTATNAWYVFGDLA